MKYLIWSNEHSKWWRADGAGYTETLEEAGRYEEHTARKIAKDSTCDGVLAERRIDPVTGRGYSWLSEHAVPAPDVDQDRPMVVTLCGSTRFHDEFQRINYELTIAGCIVISVGFYWNAPGQHGEGVGLPDDPATRQAMKEALDELHKRKIDLADMVMVVNPGGYIGESTRSEIQYALGHGKKVAYAFEPDRASA